MSVKALVELSDAIVSGRDSDHLRRFPGRFNLYKAVFQARGYRRGREPVFAQTARAQSQTTTSYRCHSLYVGSAVWSVRLAERPHHRQTRHVDSLAPHRLPFVLEEQVSASRTTSRSSPAAEADRRDGNEQPNLGRGAHCRRTIAQDWHPDFATYCSALHAEDTTASCGPEATVDDLRAQSRKRHHCV